MHRSETQKTRVFLADDHAVLRSGLRLLIQMQDDMEVVGEAGDFPTAITRAGTARPDVMIVDVSMPGNLGLAAIEKIRGNAPACRVIVLTMHDDPAYLRTALAMGASGYVVKSAADTELLSAIRAVHQGRVFVDARSSAAISGLVADSGGQKDSLLPRLSSREREVLVMLAEGHTNRAVADKLDISVKTVESYRSRLVEKLGLKNRADLTRFALEHGLLSARSSEPQL
jgi:DNA-binding NarL/FixJ family response regulator